MKGLIFQTVTSAAIHSSVWATEMSVKGTLIFQRGYSWINAFKSPRRTCVMIYSNVKKKVTVLASTWRMWAITLDNRSPAYCKIPIYESFCQKVNSTGSLKMLLFTLYQKCITNYVFSVQSCFVTKVRNVVAERRAEPRDHNLFFMRSQSSC